MPVFFGKIDSGRKTAQPRHVTGFNLWGGGMGASALIMLIFGSLAVLPMLTDENDTTDNDELDEPIDDGPDPGEDPAASEEGESIDPALPGEETIPVVTISTAGGDPADALTREGGTDVNSDGDIIRVLGTTDADTIVASEDSDPDLAFLLEAGDDAVTVRLGQDVNSEWTTHRSDDPSGSDTITLQASAEDIAAYQQLSGEAETASDIPPFGTYQIDEDDTVEAEIDEAVEGRLVQLIYTDYSQSHIYEPRAQDMRGLLIVPDGVDVEERIAENFTGAVDENGDFLVLEDGAVRIADIELGGYFTSFNDATGESTYRDTVFEWDGLTANREIETYTITNIWA